MTKLNEIYKCNVCGNIVEVLHTGAGALVCCGEEMVLLSPKKEDTGQEKHVPIVEKTDRGYKVTVGEVLHPMQEEHYIEWIELIVDGKLYRQYLKPGEEPVAEFNVQGDAVVAREYCNVHGHWVKE